MVKEFSVKTRSKTDFIDITPEIERVIRESGTKEGICTVFIPHTTAAVTINENADPDVVRDMSMAFDKIVPWADSEYRHMEGNSAAHLKSSLIGCSETLLLRGGRLVLGRWQSVYFCEFDGPRLRNVYIKIT